MVLHWSESNKKAQLVNDYYKFHRRFKNHKRHESSNNGTYSKFKYQTYLDLKVYTNGFSLLQNSRRIKHTICTSTGKMGLEINHRLNSSCGS